MAIDLQVVWQLRGYQEVLKMGSNQRQLPGGRIRLAAVFLGAIMTLVGFALEQMPSMASAANPLRIIGMLLVASGVVASLIATWKSRN